MTPKALQWHVIVLALAALALPQCGGERSGGNSTPEEAFWTTVEHFKQGNLDGIESMLLEGAHQIVFWPRRNTSMRFPEIRQLRARGLDIGPKLRQTLANAEVVIVKRQVAGKQGSYLAADGHHLGFRPVREFTEENTKVSDERKASGFTRLASFVYAIERPDKPRRFARREGLTFVETDQGWKLYGSWKLLWLPAWSALITEAN